MTDCPIIIGNSETSARLDEPKVQNIKNDKSISILHAIESAVPRKRWFEIDNKKILLLFWIVYYLTIRSTFYVCRRNNYK